MSGNGSLRKRLKPATIELQTSESPALITYARPRSEAAEAYRSLRTSILLSSYGAPPKVILVTSAVPQEGKTTISANSAMVLAQRGGRVLLVDADLRRPGIDRMFGFRSAEASARSSAAVTSLKTWQFPSRTSESDHLASGTDSASTGGTARFCGDEGIYRALAK